MKHNGKDEAQWQVKALCQAESNSWRQPCLLSFTIVFVNKMYSAMRSM